MPNGTPEKLDTSVLDKLGWRSKTNLEEGIKLTLKAYDEDLKNNKLRINNKDILKSLNLLYLPLLIYLGERSLIAYDEGFYTLQVRWILKKGWIAPLWFDK